jgi:hypothetical protein
VGHSGLGRIVVEQTSHDTAEHLSRRGSEDVLMSIRVGPAEDVFPAEMCIHDAAGIRVNVAIVKNGQVVAELSGSDR